MPTLIQTAPGSKARVWAGGILSGLVVAFLAFDAVMKLVKPAPVVEAFVEGWPERLGSERDPADRLSRWRCRYSLARRRSVVQPRIVPDLYGRAALGGAVLARRPPARAYPAAKLAPGPSEAKRANRSLNH